MTKMVKHKLGFYQLKDKPSASQLKKYYHDKYYQENSGNYDNQYSEEEKQYILNKSILIDYVLNEKIGIKTNNSMLDVGAGQGWSLDFFDKKSWDVTGLDFSDFGCKSHNPRQLKNLVVGDIYDQLDLLNVKKQTYDLIILGNLLEHVLNPVLLINKLKSLMHKSSYLVITVPNDFSSLQNHLKKRKFVDKDYWVCVPDHISYFNRSSLHSLLENQKLKIKIEYGEYPIETLLFSDETNYVQDRKVGKIAHQIRISTENYVMSKPLSNALIIYKAWLDADISRQITCFARL